MKSLYYANQVCNAFASFSTLTGPSTLYVGLLSSLPATNAGPFSEITGTGYVRASIANGSAAWGTSTTTGVLTSASDLSFGTAGGTWTTATAFAIYDAASGGNVLAYGPLSAPITPVSGETITAPTGSIVLQES